MMFSYRTYGIKVTMSQRLICKLWVMGAKGILYGWKWLNMGGHMVPLIIRKKDVYKANL
ncbi:MAG: hypothetical protein JRI26_11430 [Deltaproteobacteria bacterium]|nr:hypothetical protein [Deltaproteobacteria bacterium]